MKYLKLSGVALWVLCAIPVLAAEPVSTPAVAPTAQQEQAAQPIQQATPAAPAVLPADLFAPQAIERGYMGPCTITVTCHCVWGDQPISCSGLHHCVGYNAVNCDEHEYANCTQICAGGPA